MASNKLPPSGHVVYDSSSDISTGKKRAVMPGGGGGVSVAERARLFGTQIAHSSAPKPSNSTNPQTQRAPLSNQSNVIRQERNYQTPRTDVNQRPKQQQQQPTYSQRIPNDYRSATAPDDRPKHEQAVSTNVRQYSKPIQSNYHPPRSPPRQRPEPSYDRFNHSAVQKHVTYKSQHPRVRPSEPYSSDDAAYSAPQNKQKSTRHPDYRAPNYFQPIKDPLEVLFKDTPHEYIQQEMPTTNNTHVDEMQPFDLASLINRIQQDYADHARPYVSSVQFVEHTGDLSNIGFLTPAVNRKDYAKRPADTYSRRVPKQQYDIIETNGFYPYERTHSNRHNNNHHHHHHYSSMEPERRHKRYHNQASSPIHILESSNYVDTRAKQEIKPPSPVPKAPTPVAVSSDDEKMKPATKQPEASKSTEEETSSEEESETEEESTATALKPPPTQTTNGPAHVANTTGTPGTQPTAAPRTTLPNVTPTSTARGNPKPIESDETDDSDDDDSESNDESEEEAKPKPQALLPPRPNMQRTTPGTPQSTSRAAPQRGNLNNYTMNQPAESTQSTGSLEVQEIEKSTSFGGKLKSIKNVFRRNKS